jgi:hypothetical protein
LATLHEGNSTSGKIEGFFRNGNTESGQFAAHFMPKPHLGAGTELAPEISAPALAEHTTLQQIFALF